eukprot:TRINITY_DN167_c0_g1_i1.p1 TRINITY_DN167_c0_g1~~TRINITY_DN167_c0_g1_i1.p1  ORF type:complete len:472 (-),score=190.31 TRINITY_DN167_c0_g1_i1:127-1467(-)
MDPTCKPFTRVIKCNIGNPQALKMKPLTFPREVLSLIENPALLEKEKVGELFSPESIERARELLAACAGSGAYTHSKGVGLVRDSVARFIQARDGLDCSAEDIYLTDGASPAIQRVLSAIIRPLSDTPLGKEDGILIPTPQYPLYSGSIRLYGGHQVPYMLNEDKGWDFDLDAVKASLSEAQSKGHDVRAIVVINPGNPTGTVMSRESMESVVKFCHEEQLVLLADEVYQENIYDETKPFVSFKKVVIESGLDIELFSFHSVSKGFLGECGHRGGYMEVINVVPEVHAVLYKQASMNLCSNTMGQFMVQLMVNPPAEGTDSYKLYCKERDEQLASLKRRATKLTTALEALPGMTCLPAEGSMYCFPRIDLPEKLIAAAKEAGKAADTFYCLALLEKTGICVVPGSGFGQRPNTYHFRTTFLPQECDFDDIIEKISVFHKDILEQYA